MKYINTDELIEREGQLFFHIDKTWTSAESEGLVSSDMEKRPDIFSHPYSDEDPTVVWDTSFMWRTSLLFPAFKYDPATDTFTEVDSWKQDWAKAAVRRRMINDDLAHGHVCVATELKKLRLVIKAIVVALPELKVLPEVQDFESTSDYIEVQIAKHPKDFPDMRAKEGKRNKEHIPFFIERNPNRTVKDEGRIDSGAGGADGQGA